MSRPFPLSDPPLPPPPIPWPASSLQKWPLNWWLTLLTAECMVMNAVIVPVMDGTDGPDEPGALWGTFCMGSVGGQAGLLAIAAVLGPSSTLRRHLVVFSLAAALVLAWVVGFLISRMIQGYEPWDPSPKDILSVLLVLPLLFCLCELPLWIVRTFFRWRIESQADVSLRLPQLSIAGILAATAAVALSLGAIRLGQKLGDVEEGGWWFGVGVAAGFTWVLSALVLPIVTAILYRTQSLFVGTLVSAAWISLLVFLLVVVISILTGDFPTREAHLFMSLLLGFVATLIGPLALTRLFGYRLLWGREFGPGDGEAAENKGIAESLKQNDDSFQHQ